jgi:hypothetical protein
MSPRKTAPVGGSMARRGVLKRRRARLSSALALGLKSTYRREMHLAFCPSRQIVEVGKIYSTPPSERTINPRLELESLALAIS